MAKIDRTAFHLALAGDRVNMDNTRMGTQQLLDALTDHLALYHRKASCPKADDRKTKCSVRDKVLEWFRGLTTEQRRSILTISDRSWVAVLLQMQRRLEREGPGFFFLLTDVLQSEPVITSGEKPAIPSSQTFIKSEQEAESKKSRKSMKSRKKTVAPASSSSSSSAVTGSLKKPCQGVAAMALPGLCFRKAKGLLARLDEEQGAGELLCGNLELFSTVEATAAGLNLLDTVSISEDLLRNVDQFLAMMDAITHSEFFVSVGAGRQDSSWEELPWLKSMGYYTMAAFVANKVELAMWSAWLQDEGAHRPSRNLSKELRKTGRSMKTPINDVSASTVCRRSKGFRDWWMTLAEDVKSKALRLVVARAAKLEVMQAVRASRNSVKLGLSKAQRRGTQNTHFLDLDLDQWGGQFDENQGAFGSYIVGLDAIRNLTSSPLRIALSEHMDMTQAADYKWLFCSSLDSVDTLPGYVMRRAQSALQEVMVESMELDLLKSESCISQVPSKSIEGKTKKESRRKKNRNSVQSKSHTNSGNEVVQNALVLSKEQLENSAFYAVTVGEKHEGVEKQMVEKCKLGKKKKYSRVRLNDTKESCLAMEGNERKERSGSTLEEDRNLRSEKTPDKDTHTEKAVDSDLADTNSLELFGSGMLTPHNNDLDDSCFQQLELSEHKLCSSSTIEASKNADSPSKADLAGHDICKNLCKSDEQGFAGKGLLTPAPNEKCTLEESSLHMSLKTSAIFCNTERVCCEDEPTGTAKEDMQVDGVIAGLNTKPMGFEIKETQFLSSPASNPSSTPTSFSRSPGSSHMSRESYWEGLRSQTFNSQSSTSGLCTAHEWPRTFQVRFSRGRSQIMSPATERLHLDVGRNWQQRLQASLIALRNPIMKQQSGPVSNSKRSSSIQNNFKSPDCAPLFSSGYNLAQTRGYPFGPREETGVFPLSQPSFPSPFAGPELTALARAQEESKHDDRTPDDTDYDDSNYFSGDFDDHEGYFISEEEGERQFLDLNIQRQGDYNQYFGGGVMFWNTADYAGTGYSRPPSLSSEDSSWARHEADLSVVLDDIMGLSPMSGAYTNVASPGIVSTSPPTTTYHPGFEHNPVNTTPRVGLPLSGSEFGKFPPLPPILSVKSEDEQVKSPNDVRKVGVIDGIVPDIVTRPILRPIIVVRDRSLGRQVSGSESIRHHEARSPHVPRGRRELPWQRRPPSPVLRCVPPSPPPPPPSPVSGFGKRKGLTTVRSGSSSPRRWGLINSYHKEEQDVPLVLSEVLKSAWGNRSMRDSSPIHPISGALLRERLFTIPPLAIEKDHPDIALPMQTTLLFNSNPSLQSAITRLHSILHEEIEGFCKQVAAENLLRKLTISTAVDKVAHAMQVLWPRSRLKIFGSNATGLALPCSDVDLVVCLPPVRNLEPIKEAGILEGRNGIKETCLQHAARYLADQDWVKSDTLKTIENTAIPIIMLVAHVSPQLYNITDICDSADDLHSNLKEASSSEERKGPWGGNLDRELVRLDISFEAPSHTGLRTAELVRELTAQFPAIVPLALILKQFLTDRSLDHPYTGGLSSYCLVILITRFLQHQHHLGWPFQQNLGSLLIDFLHFFGCVFDPRRMGICIRGGGMYVNRDRGHSIDPLHIEDPLHPSNNVGRNCFRILQCVKAFADAYSYFEKALVELADNTHKGEYFKVLPNILPSVESLELISD